MSPCTRNRYASEANAEAALGHHPGARTVQYCEACDAWHITRSRTRLSGPSAPVQSVFNHPADPVPDIPARWRGWCNTCTYAAGDAVAHGGRAWLAVVNWTMDRPGASAVWREITPCMGEPYCAPEVCGPPCHHPACPEHAPAHL
ncbi:hypothetical protein ABZT04_20220 [Streptomyces sp. NPDC005492]|uniref:hypothetical protein n=1 Tax=Streptomyces sp. NPDC005492 TaxID=3156883 RepID=UPI0033A32375